MTTVGVASAAPCRVDALRMPSYNHHYRAFKTTTNRYHLTPRPAILAFRRLSRDMECRNERIELAEISGCAGVRRPPGEGVQHRHLSSTLPPPCLAQRPAPRRPITHREVTSLSLRTPVLGRETARWARDGLPEATSKSRELWNNFLSKCPERFEIELPLNESTCQVLREPGYAWRYLRPRLACRPAPASLVPLQPSGVMPALPSPYRGHRVLTTAATAGAPLTASNTQSVKALGLHPLDY